jgi:predicted helicase
VLDSTKIKARKRLFMTATPRYFTGRVKKEAKEADWEVASMDEEAKFGTVLHRLSFAQAIDLGLLSDYQVVVVGVGDDEAQDLAARGAFVTRDATTVTDARTLSRQIGLLRAMAKHDLHRVVSFHSRIDHASRFASSLQATNNWLPADRRLAGTLWADHVSGDDRWGERRAATSLLTATNSSARTLSRDSSSLGGE